MKSEPDSDSLDLALERAKVIEAELLKEITNLNTKIGVCFGGLTATFGVLFGARDILFARAGGHAVLIWCGLGELLLTLGVISCLYMAYRSQIVGMALNMENGRALATFVCKDFMKAKIDLLEELRQMIRINDAAVRRRNIAIEAGFGFLFAAMIVSVIHVAIGATIERADKQAKGDDERKIEHVGQGTAPRAVGTAREQSIGQSERGLVYGREHGRNHVEKGWRRPIREEVGNSTAAHNQSNP